MKKKILILSFILGNVNFSCNVLWSQITADDYKRADDLSRITADKVFYGNVRPSWIGTTGRFSL